ncbi:MAG: hypothetical protein HQM12_09475 [SAR324 cluster bacterium]|nr:hypothetical protein [SAR324 cluster bacterium]MBF0350151.1 hypothetical protein [SAR324 cluster bacterium]
MSRVLILTLVCMLSSALPLQALETAPRITDRELIEILTELKEGQKRLELQITNLQREMDKRFEAVDKRFDAVDKRFEAVDKRFEAVDKRFEAVDKRFEEVNQRFEMMNNLIIGILTAFAGIVAATISFALWDRRTMIRPFETKVKHIEDRQDALETEMLSDRKKFHQFVEAFRTLAQTDTNVAKVLKSFSLM